MDHTLGGTAIPLARPGAVVGLTRSAPDQALGSAAAFAAVPARAFAVLDKVETLLRRINVVVDRIEGTLDRTDRVLDDAEAAVREVGVLAPPPPRRSRLPPASRRRPPRWWARPTGWPGRRAP